MILKIVDEIEKSMENECYMAALALALTLPDICGKAEYHDVNNKMIGKRYRNWFDEFLGKYEKPLNKESDDMPYTSGEIVYSLRNCLLHQGTPNVESEKIREEQCRVDRFVLTIDDAMDGGGSQVSYGKDMKIVHRELEVNIHNLCKKLCAVSKAYYLENKEEFNFFEYTLVDKRKEDWIDDYLAASDV